MPTFSGLPGVKNSKVQGLLVDAEPTEFIRALKRNRVASCASDHGSLTAWVDDAGSYRAALCRFRSIALEGEFADPAALRDWLEKTLPELDSPAA
jgi:hypothetical protein